MTRHPLRIIVWLTVIGLAQIASASPIQYLSDTRYTRIEVEQCFTGACFGGFEPPEQVIVQEDAPFLGSLDSFIFGGNAGLFTYVRAEQNSSASPDGFSGSGRTFTDFEGSPGLSVSSLDILFELTSITSIDFHTSLYSGNGNASFAFTAESGEILALSATDWINGPPEFFPWLPSGFSMGPVDGVTAEMTLAAGTYRLTVGSTSTNSFDNDTWSVSLQVPEPTALALASLALLGLAAQRAAGRIQR